MLKADNAPVKYRRLSLLLLVLLPGLLPVNAPAEMYKWVDEDGNVNYTQSPPPGNIEAIVIEPAATPQTEGAAAALQSLEENLQKSWAARETRQEQQRKQKEAAAQQQRLCEQAKARVSSYERPRVTIIGADGNRRRATEEERVAELEKSRRLVDELCK